MEIGDLELTPLSITMSYKWDINGTTARSHSEPKIQFKKYNPNMDLELDPGSRVNPQKLISIWYSYGDNNLRW